VFRNTKPVEGRHVLIPGDPEREEEQKRTKSGIPLVQPVVESLLNISKQTGVPFKNT
jgi:LDH2 family malate/lactate/ureidoglycolate dehydrogenase